MINKINSNELDYDLPSKNIKQIPYLERDQSLILNAHNNNIIKFANIIDFLPIETTLILNKSSVQKVRVLAKNKITGGKFEIFILSIIDDHTFECLLQSRSSKTLETVLIANNYEMRINSRKDNVFNLSLLNSTCKKLIDEHGRMPLPPYIIDDDKKYSYYQNEFAEGGFSVAAPTAGLHFTNGLLKQLSDKGIKIKFLSLDVGLDTFLPIKTEYVDDHKIHNESYIINEDLIEHITKEKKNGNKIVCVGTTALRALESAYQSNPPTLAGETDLFIKRGYEFKIVDGLITNFHAPRSSLIAIIDSILGSEWKNLYEYALESGMKFLSFGDSMYIEIDRCKI